MKGVVKSSSILETAFQDVWKTSFVTQFVSNRYEMYCEMGIFLTQMLH